MSGGILSRLRRRRAPAAAEPVVPRGVVAEPQPEAAEESVARQSDVPERAARVEPEHEASARDEAEPRPPDDAGSDPQAGTEPDRASAPALLVQTGRRSLPSFRPVASSEPSGGEPLSVTLSEAIALVQGAGGDVIELRFLRRELDRRTQEGSEPAELWLRIEKAVGGRLRRVGKLADGQSLVLQRDL